MYIKIKKQQIQTFRQRGRGEGGGHPDKNLNPRKMKSNSS